MVSGGSRDLLDWLVATEGGWWQWTAHMTPHPSLQPYTRSAHSPLPKIWGGRRGQVLEGRGSWGHPDRGMGDITAGMACPRAKQGVTACPTCVEITRKRQEAGAAGLGTGDRDCWQGRARLSTAQHGCDSRGGSDSRARAVSHLPRASLHPWTLPPADAQGNKSQARRREWGAREGTGVPSPGCGG